MPPPLSIDSIQSGGWFDLIVEGVPGAIIVADRKQRITLVNRNTEALFRYFRTELIGQLLDLGRDLFGLRKDGVEIGLNPIETPDGPFTFASIIDITERQRADARERQMAALVESADDAIWTKSLVGVIRSWNPGADKRLDFSAAEIIGPLITTIMDLRRNRAKGWSSSWAH